MIFPYLSLMHAIGYIRLSDEDQSNYSIDSQRRQITEYCDRNKLTLLKIYQDNGQSSYTFDRKAFNKLDKDIKQAQFLIVYHLDRFSRNMAEALLKIRQYLEAGIRIRDISEPIDMDDYDSNTFLLRSMKFMVAESELMRIRQRTRQGMHQAKINGRYISHAPIGYVNARDEKDKSIILIDPLRYEMVKIVFREYIQGCGIEEVRRRLKAAGYTTIKGNSTIQNILSNPVYAGFIKVPATKEKPAHLVKGLHDPIISEFDYWRIQDRLKNRTVTSQNREEVPLRGVLYCGCGSKFTAGNCKGKRQYYWYYMCPRCRLNLSAIKLHDKFDQLLDNLSFDETAIDGLRKRLLASLKQHLTTRDGRIAQLQVELASEQKKIEVAERKYLLRPNMSESTYNSVMAELRTRQASIYDQLAELSTGEDDLLDKLNEVLGNLSNVKVNFEKLGLEKKQQFIKLVFNNSLLFENSTYKTPSIFGIFSPNLLELKEKGLLEIVAPVMNLGITPASTGDRSNLEHEPGIFEQISKLYEVFAA